MNRCLSVVCAVTCCVLSTSLASAVKLEYKVKVGDQWKQKNTIKGSGSGEAYGGKFELATDIGSRISNSVTATSEDGSFVQTVDYNTDRISVTVNGSPMSPESPSSTKPLAVTSSKLGRPTKVEGLEGSMSLMNCDLGKLMSLFPAQFPDKEVNVGDTWTAKLDVKGLPVEVTGKLVSLETVEGKNEATVKCDFNLSGEGLSKLLPIATGVQEVSCIGRGASWTTTTHLDVTTGLPRSATGVCDLDATFTLNGQQIPFLMKTTYETEPVK